METTKDITAESGSPPLSGSASLARTLKSLYYRIFKRYRRLELKLCTYAEGDKLIRASAGKAESETWVLAIPEEDNNRAFGVVYLERRERISMQSAKLSDSAATGAPESKL
jgi:hypothetical protein